MDADPRGRARPPALPSSTPLMAQYLQIKAAHPECLVFYRLGDFYELFFEDAVRAARALDITLTKRGQHEGRDVPMCGVPVHAYDAYLARLIRAGFKVAIAEQTEEPSNKRGALIRREVVRIVTPGTLTEEALLDPRRHNYLAALARAKGEFGLAWLDLSTGDFQVSPTDGRGLAADLARIDPGEIVLPDSFLTGSDLAPSLADWKDKLTALPPSRFDSAAAERRLREHYGVATLDAFGAFNRASVAAAGILLDYVALTQAGRLPDLKPPRLVTERSLLMIDAATRRNLEVSQSLAGEKAGSLLGAIDRTLTAAGGRLLASRLASPLAEAEPIRDRLDQVGFFIDEPALRERLGHALKNMPDIARALMRLRLGRAGPRDLGGLRDGLKAAMQLRETLGSVQGLPQGLQEARAALSDHGTLIERLDKALAPDLPLFARDGGFIAANYRPDLDAQRELRDESRRLIAALAARYQAETGVASLKIKHNNVLGFFIEVANRQAEKMGPSFIHRQSLPQASRYTTAELAELESRIGRASERALAIELEVFGDLCALVLGDAQSIDRAAEAAAQLDVALSAAKLAADLDWCRPVIDESCAFRIEKGRHPVVEQALKESAQAPFIANDCDLSERQRLWLITGPNMAGKSTYLRQNALIAILAQAGFYVPATSAHIGVIDRLFSRVGAADDLARGRSTFMVEMVETAAILNQAGPRSLVLLDEIGRGTATFDGLSLAWAIIEHLHGLNRCRGLFATHYHELTALAEKLDSLANYAMQVKEWKGEVVFLHEIAKGAADRSYGIHVGELAGLPNAVIARAGEVLEVLEKSGQTGAVGKLIDDLPLFSAAGGSLRPKSSENEASEIEKILQATNLDELSPRQALDLLYQLRALASRRP